ncbi:1520_t:CDS:2 [Entrophospora sp. SA101]|nr:1520_t:CDS:2 [Entrophospora sp. SA101]
MSNYLRANFLRKLKPNLSSLSATITTANSAKCNINNKTTLFLTNSSLKPKLFNNNKNYFTTFSKISSLNINNFKSSPFSIKQFSTTVQNLSNTADKNLATRLKEEIKYEKESESLEKQPEFIKEFLDNNPFKIEDKQGSNEVKLTRTFGNEKIRLLFDVSFNENQSDQFDFPEDEEESGVESENTDDDLDDDENASDGSMVTRCNIIIEKDNHGALGFETSVSDGIFIINYVTYYKDAKLSYDWSAEADWKRRGHYPGPQFETLDNELQALFEKYIEERGIDTAVALFIQSYVEYKDQREYVNWLEKVEKFIGTP